MAEALQRKSAGVNIKGLYGYSEDELLKSTKVAAYSFNLMDDGKVSVEELKLNDYGFDVKSINTVIEAQNSITNDLFDRLTYETDSHGDE